MLYSENTAALVCGQRVLDPVTISRLKSVVSEFNGLKYVFVSLADEGMLADDLKDLSEWVDFLGRCRHMGVSLSEVDGMLTTQFPGRKAKARLLVGVGPKETLDAHYLMGKKFRHLSLGKTGVVVRVEAGALVLQWPDRTEKAVTEKTLRDRRRYCPAP